MATEFYWKAACQKLTKNNVDVATYLGDMPETVVSRAMTLLASRHKGRQFIRDFLELFGHRAPQDYELAQPRYGESPELFIQQAERLRPGPICRGCDPTADGSGSASRC